MDKLTNEEKLWSVGLFIGLIIVAVLKSIVAMFQFHPIENIEFEQSFIISTVTGSFLGVILTVLFSSFLNKIIIDVLSVESHFSYGVSFFCMSISLFIVNLTNIALETMVDTIFFGEYYQIVILVSNFSIVVLYCIFLVYRKQLTLLEALLSGIIIFLVNELISLGTGYFI